MSLPGLLCSTCPHTNCTSSVLFIVFGKISKVETLAKGQQV